METLEVLILESPCRTRDSFTITRAHKNGRLEYERVTPIEACSPVKINELY